MAQQNQKDEAEDQQRSERDDNRNGDKQSQTVAERPRADEKRGPANRALDEEIHERGPSDGYRERPGGRTRVALTVNA